MGMRFQLLNPLFHHIFIVEHSFLLILSLKMIQCYHLDSNRISSYRIFDFFMHYLTFSPKFINLGNFRSPFNLMRNATYKVLFSENEQIFLQFA